MGFRRFAGGGLLWGDIGRRRGVLEAFILDRKGPIRWLEGWMIDARVTDCGAHEPEASEPQASSRSMTGESHVSHSMAR